MLHKIHPRARRAVACAAILIASHSVADGADRTWTNAGGGTFQTTTNWAASLVPGAADRAIFDATGFQTAYTVNFNGSITNDQLSISDVLAFALAGNSYTLNGSSPLRIGDDGVDLGSLSISNGTFTTSSTSASSLGAVVNSPGALVVASSGTLSLGGALFVGNQANGTLGVNGRYTGTSMLVGADATGVVTISGANANVTLSGSTQVGNITAGTMTVLGGTFQTNLMNVADQPGATGVFTLNSTAAVATVSTITRVAQFNNTGVLNVTAGTFNSNSTLIGGFSNSAAGDGTVIVGGGSNAARFNNSTEMRVGNGQSGSPVGGNGTLIVSGSNAELTTGVLNAGTLASNGYIRVQNVGAVINSGSVNIGGTGRGTLEILAGGVVNAATVIIGESLNSVGVLRMSGANSALNTPTASFRVAAFAGSTGVVDVLDGAVINSGTGLIGTTSGGNGTVNVSGTGAVWNASSNISVGSTSSSGSLRVGPGALVNTGSLSSVFVNAFGAVNLDGGTLRAGNLTKAATGVFNFNSGTLQLLNTAGSLEISAAGPLGDQLQLKAGQNLLGTTVNVSGIVAMQGGRLSAGTLGVQPGGQLLLQDASSIVAGLVANQGKVLGSGAIAGTLSNAAAGEVRASTGERIAFTAAGTSFNSGQINLLGGEVEFAGTFTNQLAGRVNGRGMLRAPAITNFGTMTFSAGISDIFGNLSGVSSCKVIVTGAANATFYGSVSMPALSEFRVSPGAFASFLGNVTGLSQFTGSGTTIFEGPASFGRISKTGATHVGPSGDLTAEHVRDGRLDVEGSAAILANGGDGATSRVNALWIDTGARLDLADNAMVIDYDGASPIAAIAGYLTAGYAGGAWNGSGIRSSVAAVTPNRAIGFAEGSEIGSPAVFAGQPADGTSVLLRYTLPGDANLDRTVNIADFALLASNFNLASNRWARGDFNYDGSTGIGDFALLAANFNLSMPADLPRGSAIPEPTGAGLLVAAALNRRFRRR